jgi:methionyl-tRNA formyltransferase
MRFAITATDRTLCVFDAFVRAGWRPLKLFMADFGQESNQKALIAFAERHNVAIQLSRMTESDLRELRDQQCEALIVAHYPWKIPNWEPYLKYAANFHPSPLPEGRGPRPVERAILEKRSDWAVTCHRITQKFDEGEILASEIFPLQPNECMESLDLKIQMASAALAARIAGPFAQLWERAQPQGKGSYWPRLKIEEHFIDFKRPVDAIMQRVRAFGQGESLVMVNGSCFVVKRAVSWRAKHNIPPGAVAYVWNRAMVIAAADGYIGLVEIDGPLSATPSSKPVGAKKGGHALARGDAKGCND